jgi:hypothetical protein
MKLPNINNKYKKEVNLLITEQNYFWRTVNEKGNYCRFNLFFAGVYEENLLLC